MKYKIIIRWLITITVLSLLMAVIPAAPALAAETIILSPVQVKVGDRVNYSGSGYGTYSEEPYYFDIYLSDQVAIVTNTIDFNVTRYKKVVYGVPLEENGTYSGYFMLNSTNSVLNEGTVGTAAPLTLTAGTTYYVYTTSRYLASFAQNPPKLIKAVATLTITPGAALDALSPATGPAGTVVSVTGTNFVASTAIAVRLDGAAIAITSGDTSTRATGILITNITIPAGAAAGAHIITVTAGSDQATATFTVTASGTLDPLQPASGAAGMDVTIMGANFAASSPIVFKFDITTITPKSGAQTGSGGTIASIITIPTSATVGAHTISVTVGTTTVTKTFTVTSAAPTTTPPTTTPPTTTPPTTTPPPTSSKATINVVQNGQAIGATIGIGGTGFTPGATVTVKWDDKEITNTKVATDTTFQVIFKAPASPHGDRKITVSDGTNTVTKTFTVESVAPKVPPPQKPQLGAKVKSPVAFDWNDVTDESLPVTYRLQVSADKSFGLGTIVLDKTGLDSSSYTMTEVEELKLAGKDTPYYWRVKAIDAASNESEWTGAGEFYVPGPFKFPTWALYSIIGGGAIVVFLVGLWVGRRTAFYY